MSQFILGFSFVLFTSIVVIAGDTILKIAADAEHALHSPLVLLGSAVYATSAMFWFLAMRHMSLGQGAVAFSMLTLLALCVIGAIWFGERVGLREMLGMGCAMLAMVLMVRPA